MNRIVKYKWNKINCAGDTQYFFEDTEKTCITCPQYNKCCIAHGGIQQCSA